VYDNDRYKIPTAELTTNALVKRIGHDSLKNCYNNLNISYTIYKKQPKFGCFLYLI